MPVLSKTKLEELKKALQIRHEVLAAAITPRALNSPNEGCRKGHWARPEMLSATEANSMALRLAVEDFKAILAEIKRLK